MALPPSQSPSSIGSPSRSSQTMSLSRSPSPVRTVLPVKKRLRWKVGCSARSLATAAVNSMSGLSASSQWTQLISLSWAYVLLLPSCVRLSSSPCSSIGTPWLSRSVAMKLRCSRARASRISGSSVGPSTPWFHERLWLSPSLLSSPLASLCFSL